jgi:DNA-binding CsgD family transcriptional regulator
MGRKNIYTSEQDLQIVCLIAEGKTVKEVADIVQINHRSVEDRILRLRKQEEALSIAHLVAKLLMRRAICPSP